MSALREIRNVRQVPGERRRRWFACATMDLIVWLDEAWLPVAFQLCYDKGRSERAVTFSAAGELSHAAVDDGEAMRGSYKGTPVLTSGGYFDPVRVKALFDEVSTHLPKPIKTFVTAKLLACAEPKAEPPAG